MKNPTSQRWDWPLAGLFVLIFFTSPGRLLATSWADDLGRIQTVAVLGAILGLALTASRFSLTIRRLLVIGYTLGTVPWQLTAIISAESSLLARLASLWGRLFFAWQALMRGDAIKDPLFFISLASLFYWFMAIGCGQIFFRRGKLLKALIPPTLPLLIIQYYDGSASGRIWILAFYFFLILLILGRFNLLESRARWQAEGVFLGTEPGFDLNNGLLAVSTLIIFAAWLAPTPATALPAAARWWRSATAPLKQTQNKLGDTLAALQGQPVASAEAYGAALGLGTSAAQGETELFRVFTPQTSLPRFYWHARTYDRYENGAWHTSEALARPFSPREANWPLPNPPEEVGQFTFEWRSSNQRSLILPGQAVWISREASLVYFSLPDQQSDPIYLQALEALRAGDQYTVHAGLNNPSLQALRAAPPEAPTWARQRYLQVPANLRPQLRALALQITRGQNTSYDKAAAITAWLRENMSYSATIDAPPPGADPVTWFLFTWKSGFCNYYASAEVLLLRSLDIPARVAAGYAQGQALGAHTYQVRQAQAHAWPEVYFSGIGWVEFEPTVSQPSLNRPSEISLGSNPQTGLPDEEDQQALRREQNNPLGIFPGGETPAAAPPGAGRLSTLAIGAGIIMLAALGLSVYGFWRFRPQFIFSPRLARAALNRLRINSPAWLERWILWSDLAPEERSFQAINQSLRWLGAPPPISASPAERAHSLKQLAPPVSEWVNQLAAEHETALFGRQPTASRHAQSAAWKIRFKTLQLLISRWLYGT